MLGGKRVSKEIVTQVLFTEARCMKYTGHVIWFHSCDAFEENVYTKSHLDSLQIEGAC